MKIFLTFILLFILLIAKAQKPDPVFAIYEQQYSQLLQSRALSLNVINTLLKDYSTSNINSDTALVHLLKQLYSSQKVKSDKKI